jgi:hypothetical protein
MVWPAGQCDIDTALDLSREPEELAVPAKLCGMIAMTPDWFPVRAQAVELAGA